MKNTIKTLILIIGIVLISGCSITSKTDNNTVIEKENVPLQAEGDYSEVESRIAENEGVEREEDLNTTNIKEVKIENKNIYRNDEFGFEFTGPEELIVEINNGLSFVTPQNRQLSLENIKNCSDNNQETMCNPTLNEMSLNIKVLNYKNNDSNKTEAENIVINGISWEKYIIPGMFSDFYFETKYNNKYYLINSFYSEEKTIDILKSFKFIK